tara:strand:+ start:3616 stop:3957 length:342 start_codon:yes stop_codon:yes gene_type:complete
MSAGKSACKHLPLQKWKQNMQPILAEINNWKWYATAGDEVYTTARNGWLEHLEARQAFSGPRIKVLYPAGMYAVFVREGGFLREAEYETGGIKVSPQQYVKSYYTDGRRAIGK